MLRTVLLNEIDSLMIGTNYFKSNDFLVKTTNDKDTYILQISYRFETNFSFTAWIPNQKIKDKDEYSTDFKIPVLLRPGEIVEQERTTYFGKSKLFEGIREWLVRVKGELQAIPIYREVKEQGEQIEDILKQFDEIKDEYFTREEAEILKAKLNDLENTIIENLRKSSETGKTVDDKIHNIENDFNILKESLNSSKKRGWAGSFVVRILEWTKDPTNRKVLTTGAEVAKELLLEAGKHIND